MYFDYSFKNKNNYYDMNIEEIGYDNRWYNPGAGPV